jgi:uncharacterized protein (UPF0335 family)
MNDPRDNTKLKTLVDRIVNLETEKAELAADIKELYAEAKAMGYKAPAVRKVVAIHLADASKREKMAELREEIRTYWATVTDAPMPPWVM